MVTRRLSDSVGYMVLWNDHKRAMIKKEPGVTTGLPFTLLYVFLLDLLSALWPFRKNVPASALLLFLLHMNRIGLLLSVPVQ